MSGNAGDELDESFTITNNNPAGCGSAVIGFSYGRPVGWTFPNLPPSVAVGGGKSVTVPFKIGISTGAQVQDYLLQFWLGSNQNPTTITIHVLSTGSAPSGQFFSNMTPKMFANYALIEYSYNATTATNVRLDLATDPTLLNQTSGTSPNARYNYGFGFGSPMDASNKATPTTIEGIILSSPQSWTAWQCGRTIYYRFYNAGDTRIASPIQSGVVDCTTVVDVLPWNPWYAAIYQGVYDARYDADNNGVINYTDYWILVRATRLR